MTQPTAVRQAATDERVVRDVRNAIAKHHFCTLATSTVHGLPHAVGIQYVFVNAHLYMATSDVSKKARNIRQNPNVAVCIPVPKYPLAPPYSVQFQGTGIVLDRDDAEITSLLERGKLKRITAFGVLKQPDLCFLRISPGPRIHTYGVGIPVFTLLRDVSHAERTVMYEQVSANEREAPK